jgi:hypothetical protein
VHVLQNKELTLAPWNAKRFPYGNSVFYHFHGLRIVSVNKLSLGGYEIPLCVINEIYKPYCKCLRDVSNDLRSIGYDVKRQARKEFLLKLIIKYFVNVCRKFLVRRFIKW